MSRRLEVELTSQRDDGTWTWRAAGAKEPRGVLDGSLLPDGVGAGDVVRVDAELDLDGIVVTNVLPPRRQRSEPTTIEVLGSGQEVPGVTQQLVGGRRRRDDDRGPRGPRRDGRRGEGRGNGRGDGRGDGGPPRGRDRPSGDERSGRPADGDRDRGPRRPRGEGRDRPRRDRAPQPVDELSDRPRPKRLRPGRRRRNEWVASLADEHKPVADLLVRGGVPAVRKALEDENRRAGDEGRPAIDPGPLLAVAEDLMPGLRAAEWLDRAGAAKDDLAELDLRDLRSVIVAADDGARSPEARALADELRQGLAGRVESEHTSWLDEVRELLGTGRIVRALRVSSRPPKAGEPFPRDLADQMVNQAQEALGPDVSQQRWGAVLEAVAYSPVRLAVTPASMPAEPGEELRETVQKIASRVPDIASALGVSPAPRRRGRPGGPQGRGASASVAPGQRTSPPPPPSSPDTTGSDPASVADVPSPGLPTEATVDEAKDAAAAAPPAPEQNETQPAPEQDAPAETQPAPEQDAPAETQPAPEQDTPAETQPAPEQDTRAQAQPPPASG